MYLRIVYLCICWIIKCFNSTQFISICAARSTIVEVSRWMSLKKTVAAYRDDLTKYVNRVLGQNTPCVNFMATGTRISPHLCQKFHKNRECALDANQEQFYTSYCLTPLTNIIFIFSSLNRWIKFWFSLAKMFVELPLVMSTLYRELHWRCVTLASCDVLI